MVKGLGLGVCFNREQYWSRGEAIVGAAVPIAVERRASVLGHPRRWGALGLEFRL